MPRRSSLPTYFYEMLKLLRIFFIAVLMLCFLISCRHRRQESQAVLKTASVPPGKKQKKMPAPAPSRENTLKENLGLSAREINQSRLYSFVMDWYGTPYKYGGCQQSGVDCSCFAGLLCEKVYGMKLPRRTEDIFKSCDHFSVKEAREGDLLFFRIGGKTISHVAVYLKNDWFVHASTSRGVMVNSLSEAYYKKYFFCAGRLKEA